MNKVNYAERHARELHERHMVDELLPGANAAIELALRKTDEAADALQDAQRKMNASLAGNPQMRLEHAARLLEMPAGMFPTLIDVSSVEYVEHILLLIEQRLGALRAKVTEVVSLGDGE